MIRFIILVSRQGKTRLEKFYSPYTIAQRQELIRQVTQAVITRSLGSAHVMAQRDHKIVYKRYASLYFIVGLDEDENELTCLEFIHFFVEVLDRYFGNVCELDLIFNFHKVHNILDELVMDGEIIETSKKSALRIVAAQDVVVEDSMAQSGGLLPGTDFGKRTIHSL